ncbi:MAG: hypothetical protein J0H42_02470 [Rhizobiales bacterium]|nr:hypothetical protein [Hyphomicrobiales bacterium]
MHYGAVPDDPRRHLPGQRRGAGAWRRADQRFGRNEWQNGWSAAATFEGEFSDITRAYAGKGVVRCTW